jgi:transposase-like protein
MNTTNHTRENLTGENRLQPRKEKLIAISPHRELWINNSGTASFVIDELRRNACANDEVNEIVSVDVRLDLLTPKMKVLLAKFL